MSIFWKMFQFVKNVRKLHRNFEKNFHQGVDIIWQQIDNRNRARSIIFIYSPRDGLTSHEKKTFRSPIRIGVLQISKSPRNSQALSECAFWISKYSFYYFITFSCVFWNVKLSDSILAIKLNWLFPVFSIQSSKNLETLKYLENEQLRKY